MLEQRKILYAPYYDHFEKKIGTEERVCEDRTFNKSPVTAPLAEKCTNK